MLQLCKQGLNSIHGDSGLHKLWQLVVPICETFYPQLQPSTVFFVTMHTSNIASVFFFYLFFSLMHFFKSKGDINISVVVIANISYGDWRSK